MPFEVHYGNPYSPGVGRGLFSGAEAEASFTQRVETNRLKLQARQLDLENARIELQREDSIYERKYKADYLKLQRDEAAERIRVQEKNNEAQLTWDEKKFGQEQALKKEDWQRKDKDSAQDFLETVIKEGGEYVDEQAPPARYSNGRIVVGPDGRKVFFPNAPDKNALSPKDILDFENKVKERGGRPMTAELQKLYQENPAEYYQENINGQPWIVPNEAKRKVEEGDVQRHFNARKVYDGFGADIKAADAALKKAISDGMNSASDDYKTMQADLARAKRARSVFLRVNKNPFEGAIYAEIYAANEDLIKGDAELKKSFTWLESTLADPRAKPDQLTAALKALDELTAILEEKRGANK